VEKGLADKVLIPAQSAKRLIVLKALNYSKDIGIFRRRNFGEELEWKG